MECVQYCLHEAAGSSTKLFPNSLHARDCDANGRRSDRTTTSAAGMRLADFCALPAATTAKLTEAHVAALRIYSTAAFKVLNFPLRDRVKHPCPVTVWYLSDAVSRLRAVDAADAAKVTSKLDLWRGMKDVRVTDDFAARGGTEVRSVAVQSNA